MKSVKEYFGARVKELREKRGYNQEQLAELVGIESRHISRIETGKSFTTLENVVKIAKALHVSLDSLFKFQHKKESEVIISKINRYLEKADRKQLELIFKLIQAVFN